MSLSEFLYHCDTVYCLGLFFSDTIKSEGSIACMCPPDCRSIDYRYSLSSAKYPSSFWAEELPKVAQAENLLPGETNVTAAYLS